MRVAPAPVGALAFLAACSDGSCRAREPAAEAGPLWFVDATEASGLGAFRQVNGDPDKQLIIASIGAGVALFDADGDGDLDAYLTNGSRLPEEPGGAFPPGEEPRDALWANDGHGRFVDVTEASGLGDTAWTFGVRACDVDGDGDRDVYLTSYGPNALYRSRGDGTFERRPGADGLADESWSTGAAFLDHDRDGDLDAYVANYVDFDAAWVLANRPQEDYRGVTVYYGPRGLPGAADSFFVNDGRGTFVERSAEVGIEEKRQFGFEVVPFDHDDDGWIDVYVTNDSESNHLWRNDRGARFVDRAFQTGVAFSGEGLAQAGMGVAGGDYDGDLRLDLYVTNFAEDYFTLYHAEGRFFEDVTNRMGLGAPTIASLGWGCGFVDFDSDGDLDLFAVTGHVYPQVDLFELGTKYRQLPLLFENVDGRAFRHGPPIGGPGFAVPRASRGAACGDVDGDGDVDLLVGNLDGPPTLLRNEGRDPGRWLRVTLVGRGGNREAIGARVVATVAGRAQLRAVGAAGGFLSSHEATLHFGLGAADAVERLEVRWPSGETETFEGLAAGSRITIDQGRGIVGR